MPYQEGTILDRPRKLIPYLNACRNRCTALSSQRDQLSVLSSLLYKCGQLRLFSLTTLLINYSTPLQINNLELLIKMKGFYAIVVTSLIGQGVLAASPKLNQYASIDDWYVTLRYILTTY
jgi:hypothetical protein